MRRLLTSPVLLNILFIAGASAQTAPPDTPRQGTETTKDAPSTMMGGMQDCPMMQGQHGAMMQGTHPPMGQGHGMQDGMEHCAAMHGTAAVQDHPMHRRANRHAHPSRRRTND